MSTIQQVVAATEELSTALATYKSVSLPKRFGGLSLAFEEAEGDVKTEAKAGVIERFKAWVARIVAWFKGLFAKRKEGLDKMAQQEKEVEPIIKEAKTNPPMKKAVEVFAEQHAKETKEKVDKIMSQHKSGPYEAPTKAAEPAAAPAAATPSKVEQEGAALKSKVGEATQFFQTNRSKIVEACSAALDEFLRKTFASELPAIMRMCMATSDGSNGSTASAREVSNLLQNVRERIQDISMYLSELKNGEAVYAAKIGRHSIDPEKVNAVLASEAGNEWVNKLSSHSHDELTRGYRRYCGYVVDLTDTIKSRELRAIEEVLTKTMQTTEELGSSGKATPEQIAAIQKAYMEELVPVSNNFNKILGVYQMSLTQASRIEHLAQRAVRVMNDAAKPVLGNHWDMLDWRSTMGQVCNDVTGFGK